MVIALLTDFGTRDYFVGAMKGVIYSINETAKIVDITHEISPQDVASAGFTLQACYRDFPPKTIFVTVVDPGVGSSRRAILVETKNYFFIAPDNGLLSRVLKAEADFRVFELTNKKFFAERVSRTFHGRDVFAPVAAYLSRGIAPDTFGSEIKDFVLTEENRPRKISDRFIEAEIIHIDRFGNLVTNLRAEELPAGFSVEINGQVIKKQYRFYAEAEEGEIFTIVGSAGFLEIAVFNGSAEKFLDVKKNFRLRLTLPNE
jgi:S-adenosyl-L-methionine hydrolase (adenosine-forming)